MRPSPLLALALSWPALAHAQGAGPPQAPAVYRGAAANVAPAVPVLRGSSAHGQASLPGPAQPEPATLALAGERLWLIDPAAGELVGCRLGGSIEAGMDRIRCARRPLP